MIEDINQAVKVLTEGGIILYPTDTIWGIGCDATNEKAVSRIYNIKKRNDVKSLIILLASLSQLDRYVQQVPEIAWELFEVADKPLTVILPGAKNLAQNVVAKDNSIGIRIVQDEFCKKMIEKFKKPVVSTSANISGESWPENFNAIHPEIINSVDYIVKWRQDDITPGKPSSVIKLGLKGEVEIIRK
jgi:L-threonylcarbamoyladenylate synthase